MFIIRNEKFRGIKNLFSRINSCNVNISRGGSQKSQVLSPLYLRLSSYIMAMSNFDYKYIYSLMKIYKKIIKGFGCLYRGSFEQHP